MLKNIFKDTKHKFIKFGAVTAVAVTLLGGTLVLAEPGDSDDPVVTKSYIVDVVVPQLKAYVEQRVSGNTSDSFSDTFSVVNVSAGKQVVLSGGAEFILRKGSGTVVGSSLGGLSDTTAGYDLSDGSQVPANHLLIVPRDDGRGFVASSDVIIMVKGGYSFR